MKFQPDDDAYIVENGVRVLPVRIVRVSGDLYTIALAPGKVIRFREGRLFPTAEEAEKHLSIIQAKPKVEEPEVGDPHDWERRHPYIPRQRRG